PGANDDLPPYSAGSMSGKVRPLGGPSPPTALGVAPGPGYGTLSPPGTPPAPAPTELASAAPAGGALPSGSTIDQYNYAVGLLKQANYPAAESALKAFVAQHPKDAMAGNAQYFLGDIYYQRREYAEAATAFADGYKRFPKGPKAADSLLKLSMSLAQA